MGNCLSISSNTTEGLIDYIQKNGLTKFQSKTADFNMWLASNTFGSNISRNPAFKVLLAQLKPQVVQGIKEAGWSQSRITMAQEEYINAYFTHHLMRTLLNMDNQAIEPIFSGLPVDSFLHYPKLPDYDPKKIEAFQNSWLTLDSGKVISLTASKNSEHALISALLAQKVIDAISTMNVPQIVAGALTECLKQERIEALDKHALFVHARVGHLNSDNIPRQVDSDRPSTNQRRAEDITDDTTPSSPVLSNINITQ